MKPNILIRGARQLLTLNGANEAHRGAAMNDLGLINDGGVLIVNGLIARVGPSRRIENLAEARNAIEIDASGCVVMPGFVDSHTHVLSGTPGLKEPHTSHAPRRAFGSSEAIAELHASPSKTLELRLRRMVERMFRHGTTTLEAKAGDGSDVSSDIRILNVFADLDQDPVDIVATYSGGNGVPAKYEGRSGEYLTWLCTKMLPKVSASKLAAFATVTCGPKSFLEEEAAIYLTAARTCGLMLRVLATDCDEPGAKLAIKMGAASVNGLVSVNDDTALRLARSPAVATLLPASAFDTGRYPNARHLIDRGVAVALATGFHHDSPTSSMQMVISLACTHMGMTPGEAITASTINAAHALRRSGQVGSLQYGKQADLVMLNVSDYREIPFYFGSNQVSLTVKRGEILYQEALVRCAAE